MYLVVYMYKIRAFIFIFIAFVIIMTMSLVGIVEKLIFSTNKCVFLISRSLMFLLKVICGITYKVYGELPKNNDYIIASKHESMFEIAMFALTFKTFNFIMKEEIKKIPIFGTYCNVLGIIQVNRKYPRRMLKIIKEEIVKEKTKDKGNFVVFPEGSRRKNFNDKSNYKEGIFLIYSVTGKSVVPIALDTGKCFSFRFFGMDAPSNAGDMSIVILPEIKPGLSKDEFMSTLENSIESKTKELYANLFPKTNDEAIIKKTNDNKTINP